MFFQNCSVPHSGGVSALAVTLDGLSLVSGGADGNVHVWQIASKQLLRTFSQHKSPVTALSLIIVPSKMPSEKYGQQNTSTLPTLSSCSICTTGTLHHFFLLFFFLETNRSDITTHTHIAIRVIFYAKKPPFKLTYTTESRN